MFTLKEIIDLAVRVEENGENAYRKAQKEVHDPSLASMLQRLADEEVQHAQWFSEMREKVGSEREDPMLEKMGRDILRSVLGDQAFSIQDADFSKMEDLRGLLELSIEFEKDTVVFYEMLSAFVGDADVSKEIDRIVEEENRHVRALEESLRDDGFDKGPGQ